MSPDEYVKLLRAEKNIYGRCPHCNDVFRLSEVKLTHGKEPPKDVLTSLRRVTGERDDLEQQLVDARQEQEVELDELRDEHESEIEALKERHETEIGVRVEKGLLGREKQIRQDAIARSRASGTGKVLERIAPVLTGFGHEIADVRSLFEPIDFVVFDGLRSSGRVTDITFVELKTGDAKLTPCERSILDTIDRGNVHWEEHRVPREKMRALLLGPPSIDRRRR
jgi:predicted Holliday junction resolvase-like endonuclease